MTDRLRILCSYCVAGCVICGVFWCIHIYVNTEVLSKEKCRKPAGFTAEFLGSGNWTRTSDIRINSPLFYRLNYARIALLIIY